LAIGIGYFGKTRIYRYLGSNEALTLVVSILVLVDVALKALLARDDFSLRERITISEDRNFR